MFGDITFAQAPFAALGGNTFAAAQTETSAALDSVSQQTVRGGIILEFVNAQETQSVLGVFNAVRAETSTASAAQTNIANLLGQIFELATGTDAPSAIGTFLAARVESAVGNDSFSANGIFLASRSESATGSDSIQGGIVFVALITETATGNAAVVSQVVFGASVAEIVSALNTLGVVKIANVYPTGIQLTVNIGGVVVWAVIDDSQTPNWTEIPS